MTTPAVTDPATDPASPGDLRTQIEEGKDREKGQADTIREQAFQLAGVDPTKGIGKAIATSYDGEMTKAAITKYAKSEFDVDLAEITTTPVVTDTVVTTDGDDPDAAAIAAKQAAADELAKQGKPITPETPDQIIAAAENEGDWDTAMDLKLDKINPIST